MPEPNAIDEYRNHARQYALRQIVGEVAAEEYANWYVEHYPAGDASHADVYWRWVG